MIGGGAGIKDPKTKEILVANGIIPKDDGSFVKQPDIPERQPDYFAKAATNPQTQVAQGQPQPKQEKSQQATTAYNDTGYTNSAPQQDIRDISQDYSDIARNNDELRDIQSEIRRRLGDLPTTTPSKAQTMKAVKDTMAMRNRKLSPQQEEMLANQMMTPYATPTPTSSLNQLNREIVSVNPEKNRAGISNSDTQAEKWKKLQKEQALMGMAGAQKVSKDDIIAEANASQEKGMTKVALNLAEDPRVTLSDVFNSKLNQNDPDTQLLKVLLKNKNNFVLQVKSMNFKVIFDKNQNFNVLLESGDKKEAEKMRPQLEMFLQKLKA
jgi:hypothetical protein